MAERRYNIDNLVVQRDLCVSCNACKAACNAEAISIRFGNGLFAPKVDADKCTNCMRCLDVCPSYQVDLEEQNFDELLQGHSEAAYITYSQNENIRHLSTSGGALTQMIVTLIEKKLYDKATFLIYPKFDKGNKASLAVTNDINEIISAAKSKYLPASIDGVLEYIKEHRAEKIIITATPCQLEAVRSFVKLNRLDENNYLYFGLFCDLTMNYNFLTYMSWKYGDYDEIQYRSKEPNGWPGGVLLKKSNSNISVDRNERIKVKPFFQLNRCQYCVDKLNRHADISFGDCYITEEFDVKGKSNIIVRTTKGSEVLEACKEVLYLEPVDETKIFESQKISQKKNNYYRGVSTPLLYTNTQIETTCEPIAEPSNQWVLGQEVSTDDIFKQIDDTSRTGLFRKLSNYRKKVCSLLNWTPKKYILIDISGFENKGDELMGRCIIQQLKYRHDFQIVVPCNVYENNLQFCVQNEILPLFEYQHKKLWKRITKRIKPLLLFRRSQFVYPSQISVIIDCSGYGISDPWYSEGIEQVYRKRLSQFTKKSLKYIFVPQAFGPYKIPEMQSLRRFLYEKSTLTYARDKKSYDILKEILPDTSKLRISGDFTCLLKEKSALYPILPQYTIIIPNMRMIDKLQDDNDGYRKFLLEIITYLQAKGKHLVFLNHEGVGDENLMKSLNVQLQDKLPILTNLTAIEAKSVIANADLVISSRYHGVVSGLSQRVLTLCTSWSHKYQELLNDYGVPNNILNVDDINGAKKRITDALENKEHYLPTKKRILLKEVESQAMWTEILSAIK